MLKISKTYCCIIIFSIVACILFWGLGILKNEEVIHELLTSKYEILINPLGIIQGLVVGLLSGTILYRLSRIVKRKPADRKTLKVSKNIVMIVLFLIFSFLIFSFLVIIQFEQKEPLNSLIIKIVYKYSFFFALLSSWALVGYNISLPSNLGFSPDKPIKKGNKTRLIIIWLTLITLLFFIFCPPWKAYLTAMDGEGVGQSVFADFHFISANQYNVLGGSPYIVAEIDRTFQIFLISAIFVIGIFLFLSESTDKKEIN